MLSIAGTSNLAATTNILVDKSDLTSTLWRKCYNFDPNIGWKQRTGQNLDIHYSTEFTHTNELTIISYNLMSDPDAPRFSHRLPHIIEAISESAFRNPSSARVLCLQEVDEEMLPLLLSNSKLQEQFPFSTHSPSSLLQSRRNLVTLSDAAFSYYILPFKERHKSAQIILLRDICVQVANVHLTKGLTDEAVAAKKNQMKVLTGFLVRSQPPSERLTFVAGDFNMNTSSKTLATALVRGLITPQTAETVEAIIDAEVWRDAFCVYEAKNHATYNIELFEGEQGATFGRLKNPLATMSKVVIDDRPQRYDRVLFKKEAEIQVLNFEIFDQPSDDGTCPSDHYGICAVFEMKTMRTPISRIYTDLQHRESIRIVEDSTDVRALIEVYLPTTADREVRREAIGLLQHTLSQHRSLADLILAPLGSYAMDTYFADSDVDVLAIACVTPQAFFDFATEQLRALASGNEHSFKGVHCVNSLVSII